ncbi:MAG: 4'-phosphopantetheinyl transferase superfamily protein [Planctomycetota bacterium]|nr:4'-phosphopantetheinyl transferase superfamily protein [Planctomycetota bacterium]
MGAPAFDHRQSAIHGVVAPTPGQDRSAPERVRAQREAAREALARAAALAGCPDVSFEKTSERGRPRPTPSGWHWTISHDRWFVAGAVREGGPLGVDLERVALRRRELVERVADREERRLLGEGASALDAAGFSRLWTSKEAVLKAEGIGLPGLTLTRLVGVDGRYLTWVEHDGARRAVLHTHLAEHVISLCVREAPAPPRVVWHLPARERSEHPG